MPRKTKDAPGRVTPKGGPARRGAGRASAAASQQRALHRAHPGEIRSSPAGSRLHAGLLRPRADRIMLNYLGCCPAGASNVYLFIGLGLIVAGFIAATRWH